MATAFHREAGGIFLRERWTQGGEEKIRYANELDLIDSLLETKPGRKTNSRVDAESAGVGHCG